MIIPNLVVRNVERSVRFYEQVLGAKILFTVDANQGGQSDDTDLDKALFAAVVFGEDQIMLQSVESLNSELPDHFPLDHQPSPGGTVYIRGLDPRPLVGNVPEGHLIMAPRKSWYGMMEMYVSDPDGHLICCGFPEGEGPDM